MRPALSLDRGRTPRPTATCGVRMFCLSAFVLAAAREPASSRYELYDHLYSEGYHNNSHITHSPPLLLTIRNALPAIRSVLDVGCSHGWAVEWLWRKGYEAAGVDVSTVAVALATKTRGRPGGHQTTRYTGRGGRCWNSTSSNAPAIERRKPICFTVASATLLPFPSCSFDAIMSTDVLEHLEPGDVETAVRELSRVARRYLVLKVQHAQPATHAASTADVCSSPHAARLLSTKNSRHYER